MKRLYQAQDRFEAQLLKDYLADWHIDTVMQGDYLSGGVGDLPAMQFPVLWVLEARDLPRARELIEQFQAQQGDRSNWRCERCGESNEGQFELCWHCGAGRER